MGGIHEVISEQIVGSYQEFFDLIPLWGQNFLNLFFWSLLVLIYAIFIWKFYRWIAKKDLLELNLRQYTKTDSSIIEKILNGILYFLEYIIILPFIVFVWFAIFTIFLMLLTTNLDIETLLLISVAVVTAIRMTAYYKEDLSRDLAKMIPLTLLAVAITQGTLLDFERVMEQLMHIPDMLSLIWIYLLFIIIIELILRFIDFIFMLFNFYEQEEIIAKDVAEKIPNQETPKE